MSYDPSQGFPTVVPELLYRDPTAAVKWLARVFGMQMQLSWEAPGGGIGHADLELEGGVIMVGAVRAGPSSPDVAGQARMCVTCFVQNVDQHYRTASAQGATIVSPLEDCSEGLRRYLASDLEGHLWRFARRKPSV